jgi:hypothetical protein
MKHGNKILFFLIPFYFIMSNCNKEPDEIVFTIFAKYTNYNDYEASFVGVRSISANDSYATFDFDLWSNIGVGDTREILVTMNVNASEVTVRVVSSGSGSGITKEATISGVKNGDILDLNLGTSRFTNRSASGGGGGGCDLADYNGPEFDIQLDSQCKTAFLYDCAGEVQGVVTACALYESYRSLWQGPGSFPDCPYCN